MFIDTAKFVVKGGNGGDGAVSFHHEKYVAHGGPDGGDGGHGGNVIFKASDNLSTLADFRYRKNFFAQDGKNGGASRCSGKGGENLIVKVPRGTLVKNAKTGRLIADISTDDDVLIAKGGRGGFGNARFATAVRQAPRFAKPGTDGEELELSLEMKLLADVGLLGFPNVGKSTFISAVSGARPAIANYHFTTLTPVLGVVFGHESAFVIADIPGLIEGAHTGLGLGHQFLRHVERCRLLVHMVDISGSEDRDPIEDFKTINRELLAFSKDLATRPMLALGNKCDMATPEQILAFKSFVEKEGFEFFPISAATRNGIIPALNRIETLLQTLEPVRIFEPEPDTPTLSNEPPFTVEKIDGKFVVQGPKIERLLRSVNLFDEESMHYFHKMLELFGVNRALKQEGIAPGDTVKIFDTEFEFAD